MKKKIELLSSLKKISKEVYTYLKHFIWMFQANMQDWLLMIYFKEITFHKILQQFVRCMPIEKSKNE